MATLHTGSGTQEISHLSAFSVNSTLGNRKNSKLRSHVQAYFRPRINVRTRSNSWHIDKIVTAASRKLRVLRTFKRGIVPQLHNQKLLHNLEKYTRRRTGGERDVCV